MVVLRLLRLRRLRLLRLVLLLRLLLMLLLLLLLPPPQGRLVERRQHGGVERGVAELRIAQRPQLPVRDLGRGRGRGRGLGQG